MWCYDHYVHFLIVCLLLFFLQLLFRVGFVLFFLPNSTLNLDLWSQHFIPLPSSRRFSNHASFQEILNELNDYAGQRELIAENLITGICVDLLKKLQDFKQERKTVREGGSECEREIGREGEKKKGRTDGKVWQVKDWFAHFAVIILNRLTFIASSSFLSTWLMSRRPSRI